MFVHSYEDWEWKEDYRELHHIEGLSCRVITDCTCLGIHSIGDSLPPTHFCRGFEFCSKTPREVCQ